jgi:hypothetical protein
LQSKFEFASYYCHRRSGKDAKTKWLLQELQHKQLFWHGKNELYPIFFETTNPQHSNCGWWKCGLENYLLLKSSPNAIVEVVAPRFLPELETLAAKP